MSDTILPAFRYFEKEGAIIGRLLAGYGELEFDLAHLLGLATGDVETAMKVGFRARGEKQRVDVIDALLRPHFPEDPLLTEYSECIGAIHHCRKIRNQYAHCHWIYFVQQGLYFTNMEDSVHNNGPLMHRFNHVDEPLLQSQETYFWYSARTLNYLQDIFRERAKRPILGFSKPERIGRPPFHNPPEKHPLPAGGEALAQGPL